MLPVEVLEQVRDELLDWQGTGVSVMEISHRSEQYMAMAAEAEADLRSLLQVPDDYAVLFMSGGARLQFSMLPLNLLQSDHTADYIDTGYWSQQALHEAQRLCAVNIAASSAEQDYTTIPQRSEWRLTADAAYVHYTPNETIHGVEFHAIPEVGDIPLCADMSSTLLSRPLDVRRFGVIYACAQKNLGQAGITVVIIDRDLLHRPKTGVPTMLDYQTYAQSGSMYNTPPTFAWYITGLVLKSVKRQGGLHSMAERNAAKSGKLYSAIDGSDFYSNRVDVACRSWMNIPFVLKDEQLNQRFLAQAREVGLFGLKGHRAVGGMRASLYNAMPQEGVDALVELMADFEQRNG